MTQERSSDGCRSRQLATLAEIDRRLLWLSSAIVDHANRVRPNPSGMKVGGHQASSASMTTIMTALWFDALRAGDRVSVKPHASPVLHAIEYLLGELTPEQLTTLREFGGLQSYPSRAKDPVPADYSTGSVGIGATAPLWAALARRYVSDHLPEAIGGEQRKGRQYSLVGDAELDEGACWEAIIDPMVAELGEVCWIVDFNRQSLDRIVPTLGAERLEGMFAAAGWQVLTVKYGHLLQALFARPGGDALERRIDTMSNPEYQRLLRHDPAKMRELLPGAGPDSEVIAALLADVANDDLRAALRNLGGHDLGALIEAFDRIDDTCPTVVVAYTVKGHGLATEGHPQNHSALLTETQMRQLADGIGTSLDDPWAPFAGDGQEAALCAAVKQRLVRPPVEQRPVTGVPTDLGRTPSGTATTQAALGRALLDLFRAAPEVGRRVVTVSPDVSSSTNLGGWVNKVGVWSSTERTDWFADDSETILHWQERPAGQHIELGIAETNLVGLLGELGATWSRWGQPLLPVGVMYDPFVNRALEPWSFGMYAGGQSVLVGTPSGVTLAAEGGAHQSITTPSLGIEQPGCVGFEPAFGVDTEWCLLDALGRLGRTDGSSSYLRLSTRPVDQALADVPTDPAARERRRAQVVAGGYLLRRAGVRPDLTVTAMGATVPEALEAAERLDDLGYAVDVVCVSAAGRLFTAMQARSGQVTAPMWVLDAVFPVERSAPMVTVLDGHPHTLAFLGGINRVEARHLGVSSFGQSGDLAAVQKLHGIDSDSIVRAGLSVLE
ncbi:MAG: pyruvate dehydrogenase component [Frankiaceae bacterium]|nr:pyruvate dehydrogenase component [Frankiaceae bacterium]